MNTHFTKRDARGSLEVEELSPGHLWVRVQGHLTQSVGGEFPSIARMSAANAESVVVYLDARDLKGFDPTVRQQWMDVVLSERQHLEEIVVATTGVFISLSARAAALALRPLGVDFEVAESNAAFEARVFQARRQGAQRHAA